MRFSVLRAMLLGLLALFSTTAAAQPANDPAITLWETTEGTMRLEVNPLLGVLKRIPYLNDNGRLIGHFSRAADGALLFDGYWVEDRSTSPCSLQVDGSNAWGRLALQFNREHTSFEGQWGYCDEAFSAGWGGFNTGEGGEQVALSPITIVGEARLPSTVALDRLMERLRLESRRAGPRVAGAPDLSASRLDLLRSQIEGMNIPDEDLARMIDAHFGTDDAFNPDKSHDFVLYANRIRVPQQLQDGARSFESGLGELIGVPPEVIRELHDGFFESDSIHRDAPTRAYGTNYPIYALDRLLNDQALRNRLGEEARTRLAEMNEPDVFEPSIRARSRSDWEGSDCSYNSVVGRMRVLDRRFSFLYASHLQYYGASGRNNVVRERLRAAINEAIRLCEESQGI